MSAAPAPGTRVPALALLVGLTAVALAGWAQSVVRMRPAWPCLLAFAVAALLYACADRLVPAAAEPPVAPPPPLPRRFVRLFGLGVTLCVVAGIAVYLRVGRLPTHLIWAAGLLALTASGFAAGGAATDTPRLERRVWIAGAALAGLALLVYGWALTDLPVEVHGDDAEVGLDAIRLLAYFDLFGAGWFELPRFHALPTLLGLKLFGINLLGLRAVSAAFGVGSVLLLLAVARRLWGFQVGVLAALLLITQRFFIHLSRTGYHYVDTPFLSLLVVWLFLRLWQARRVDSVVWCAIALGLGIQTYYASRLVPLLLALTWGLWTLGAPKGAARQRLALFGLVAIGALAVAAPMFGFFAHDWDAFWERTRDTSMFSAGGRAHLAYGYRTDNLGTILLIQLRAALTLFNLTADNSVQYGLNGALFEPASAALFILGVGLIVARLNQRRAQLVLLWTVVPLVAGAALTLDTPFYPRISGLVPFAVLVVALALHRGAGLVWTAVRGRAGVFLGALILVSAASWISAANLRSYFVDYAPRYRHSPSVEIAGFVRRHGAGKTTYMVGGAPAFFIRHGAISFQTYGYSTRDVENLDGFLAGGRPDPLHSTFIVMAPGMHLIPQLEASVGPLDLQTHRNLRGEIAFLTAVPHAAGDEPDPPELLQQRHEPGPGGRLLGTILELVEQAARWLLGLASAAALLLALAQAARRRPRRPGLAALAVPWRERWTRWRTRLAGPEERERRAEPPRAVIVAALLLIVAAALALRVYHVVELPAGFFCDEAGNGYNAYSLLHSGRDETGARLPLYVWSFGVSYKNPIFVYSAMLPMAVLGPTELAVRLTAALWGTATVLAMFFLGRALMGSLTGLAAALLLAVCPWHLHFSRIGFELITLPLFFVLALTNLVRWTQGRRTLAQALVLFGLALYTYVPAKLIVPVFLAGFALLFWRELWARRRETALAVGLLVITALPVAIFDLTHGAQSGSYFRRTTVLARDEPPLALARTFAENYAAFFSPEFLFEASNDRILRHSVSDHGQLYWFFAPLLVVGAAAALLRRDRALRLPLLWLGLYPVAAAMMNEIPSASRGFVGAAAFSTLAAVGAGAILRIPVALGRRRAVVWSVQALLAAAGLAVLIVATQGYWALYRDDYPLYSAKQYTGFQFGHRQVVEAFRRYYDEYDLLLLSTRRNNQPDVFLRFYDGVHQPARSEVMPPFEHREKMIAGSADAFEHFTGRRRMLFAVLPEEVAVFADPVIKDRITAPDGTAAFVLVEASALKDFVSVWRVGEKLAEDDQSPPPRWTPDSPPPEGGGQPRWRMTRQPFAGVGLNDFFTANADHACAWAVNFVTAEQDRTVSVLAGFDDSGEVWVNGERVALTPADNPETTLADSQIGTAQLIAGQNSVAVRTCEDIGDWRFYFRVENPDGSPAEGLQWRYRPRPVLPGDD